MRRTLHLVAAADFPAYAQLVRQGGMRTWRTKYSHLDEERVDAELRAWFAQAPRTNAEIRERVAQYDIEIEGPWTTVLFARTLLPLVQLPPAGHYADPRRPLFVVDPRPLPHPDDAATTVLTRYLAAFGPASKRDVAAWAGSTQRDFAPAWERIDTVAYEDENGTELLDLPNAPLPPASTKLPPRLLAHWDQPLLAYKDRARIMSPEVEALRLTISGDATVTVDGRVAASWRLEREGDAVRVTITPHTEIRRGARAAINNEAKRTARIAEPDASSYEVAGL